MRRCIPLLIFVAIGCSSEGPDGPTPVFPTSGKVVYDGKPASGVRVFFYPTSNPNPADAPMHPHGVTDATGTFSLTTYTPNDGAPEGSYQIILFWPQPTAEGEEESEGDRLHGWYDAKHSKLTAILKNGTNTLPAFQLPAKSGPPPVSEGVPGRN